MWLNIISWDFKFLSDTLFFIFLSQIFTKDEAEDIEDWGFRWSPWFRFPNVTYPNCIHTNIFHWTDVVSGLTFTPGSVFSGPFWWISMYNYHRLVTNCQKSGLGVINLNNAWRDFRQQQICTISLFGHNYQNSFHFSSLFEFWSPRGI